MRRSAAAALLLVGPLLVAACDLILPYDRVPTADSGSDLSSDRGHPDAADDSERPDLLDAAAAPDAAAERWPGDAAADGPLVVDAHTAPDVLPAPIPLEYEISSDGWGLRAPIFVGGSTPVEIHGGCGMWESGVKDQWMVGAWGIIARNVGGGWRKVRSPVGTVLRGTVWVAGAGGIWQWDKNITNWISQGLPPGRRARRSSGCRARLTRTCGPSVTAV